jgi:hypothetical protein
MPRPEVLTEGKFECAGQGLMVAGHKRASVAEIKRTLPGKITKTTSKNKTGEKVEKQPKAWWEAQVRLYGLKCDKWTIGNMQAVLDVAIQTRTLEVPHYIRTLEKKLNKVYQNWDNIEEISSDDGDDSEIVTPDDSIVCDPGAKPGKLKLGFCPTHNWHEKEKLGKALVNRTIAKMNRDHGLLLLSKEGGGDDVFGTWQIHCPGIHESWPVWEDIEKGMKWIIHPPLPDDTHSWVSFNQMVVEGVMGIEWSKKDLPKKDWFNWLNVKRGFRFRGHETGSYDFCCIDEGNLGWIMFTSEHECHGVFEVEFGEKPWEFTGKKVSLKRPGKKPAALAKEYEKLGRDFDEKTCIW